MRFSNTFSRKNRILIRQLVITDFKLRYQGSVLGYAWSLLKPLLLFAVMYVVFVHFLRFGAGIPHFVSSLLLGIVLWTFFTETVSQGMQSIVNRGDLIRKISFPKYIIVVSSSLSALINLAINLLVVFFVMMLDGVDFGWSALFFPLTALVIYAFSLGVALLLSALYVKYRDLGPIWEVFMQALFYATPIFYPLQMVLATNVVAAQILMLSPIAVLFQNARAQLVGTESAMTAEQLSSNPLYLAAPYIIIVAFIALGIWYFRKRSSHFAEEV
ncbi:MAG: ABC transporter permease [Candidatus Microsaccharimonas sp.]